MKPIALTRGYVALIDDDDFERVNRFRWHFNGSYAARRALVEGVYKGVKLHRFILCAREGQYVDHKNGDKLDCRKANLRFCTQQQNCFNSVSKKSIGVKGVSWDSYSRVWTSEIRFGDTRTWLGHFDTKEDAAYAYNQAAEKYFGEFAKLNDLPDGFVGKPKHPPVIALSGARGIRRANSSKKPWQAYFHRGGKFHNIGCFPTLDAAVAAREEALRDRA